uniref:SFRICE_030144 n=1 Tax=Spodoptera frugiperda TaxID=7108 RepID=A0A2H1WDP3_SPOFR
MTESTDWGTYSGDVWGPWAIYMDLGGTRCGLGEVGLRMASKDSSSLDQNQTRVYGVSRKPGHRRWSPVWLIADTRNTRGVTSALPAFWGYEIGVVGEIGDSWKQILLSCIRTIYHSQNSNGNRKVMVSRYLEMRTTLLVYRGSGSKSKNRIGVSPLVKLFARSKV